MLEPYWYQIGYYIWIMLPLLLIPSWAEKLLIPSWLIHDSIERQFYIACLQVLKTVLIDILATMRITVMGEDSLKQYESL